jgi:RNA polymerase sigma factor (sigma-70 family)
LTNPAKQMQEPLLERQMEATWLDTRAAEIVRSNPGGPFPRDDREFSDRTLQRLRKLAATRMRGRSYALFNDDDLFLEAQLRLVRGFPGFKGTHFHTWLHIVVRNTFFDLVGADSRTSATSIEELATRQNKDASAPEDIIPDRTDVAEEIHATTLINTFLTWLRQRNARHAKIVELEIEGLKDAEIAECLSVARSTVCSVLRRAPRDYQKFLARTQKEKLKASTAS